MTARRLVPAALVAVLALGGAACSSSGSDSSAGSTTKESTGATTSTTTADTAESSAGSTSSDGENPGVETLVDGPADAAHTVTLTASGSWDPATLEVAPGQVFTFVSAGSGSHAVTFNGSDTYTISGGLTESFTLATPGTYTVTEYLSGETMTVVVKG
jgi:plastocyanin